MTGLLRTDEVAFAYPQDGRGLAPVSLQLDEGQALYIGGESGCGKSTLARCLTGIIPHLYHGKMSGAVWLAGQPTVQAPLWMLTESAGLVFQNPASQMLAPTVEDEIVFGLENLGLPPAEIRQQVDETLADFGLDALRHRSPQTLSGGEQQKLVLAAITARHPALLVLDEPLSMLDTSAAFDLVGLLARRIAQGGAAVIFEHRQEYLRGISNLQTIHLGDALHQVLDNPCFEWPVIKRRDIRIDAGNLIVELGGRTILDGWSFHLQGGQVTALVGRNGVGKTTLLRLLAGLQSYTGALEVCADHTMEPPQLGIVFQNPDLQLFNPSVREEILYHVPQPELDLYRFLLAALDLERYEQAPPLLLSEGEKRRVALATVLMLCPRHGVLLDEPALGLDAYHKSLLLRVLRSLAATGQVVVFSTHDIELAAQADRLIMLGSSGIVASGAPQELLCQVGLWEQAGLRIPDWVQSRC
jgi:energy-coupling factor transport system ATP-binding protein